MCHFFIMKSAWIWIQFINSSLTLHRVFNSILQTLILSKYVDIVFHILFTFCYPTKNVKWKGYRVIANFLVINLLNLAHFHSKKYEKIFSNFSFYESHLLSTENVNMCYHSKGSLFTSIHLGMRINLINSSLRWLETLWQ